MSIPNSPRALLNPPSAPPAPAGVSGPAGLAQGRPLPHATVFEADDMTLTDTLNILHYILRPMKLCKCELYQTSLKIASRLVSDDSIRRSMLKLNKRLWISWFVHGPIQIVLWVAACVCLFLWSVGTLMITAACWLLIKHMEISEKKKFGLLKKYSYKQVVVLQKALVPQNEGAVTGEDEAEVDVTQEEIKEMSAKMTGFVTSPAQAQLDMDDSDVGDALRILEFYLRPVKCCRIKCTCLETSLVDIMKVIHNPETRAVFAKVNMWLWFSWVVQWALQIILLPVAILTVTTYGIGLAVLSLQLFLLEYHLQISEKIKSKLIKKQVYKQICLMRDHVVPAGDRRDVEMVVTQSNPAAAPHGRV